MGSFFKPFTKAAEATGEAFDPAPFMVKGQRVSCPVCGRREFVRSQGGPLTKPLFSRMRAPWLRLDASTTTLICTHCVLVLEFGQTPERVEVSLEDLKGGGGLQGRK
jgi:hypothetical protein